MAENSRKNSQRADHLKRYRFRPGETGNPGGRPRGTREFAELIAAKTGNGKKLINFAIAVLEGKRKGEKQWAVEFLTERMLGRAPQHIELDAKVEHRDSSDPRERLLARFSAVMAAVGVEGPADGGAALPAQAGDPEPSD